MSNDTNPDDVIVQIGSPSSINVEASARGGAAELGRRLLLAAHAGDSRLVLALMAHGAPFASDWLGTTALHLAAGAGHAHTCGVLLRAGVSRDARTKVERTPLHAAAAAGHTRVVQLLLQHGAAADCRDMLGMTALHWAAARGHCGAARALLAAGASPHARSRFRHTPADLAARARHARTHAHILEYVNQETQEQKVIFDTEQLEAAPPAPAPAPPAAPAAPAAPAPAPRDLPTLDVERGASAPSPPPPTVLGAVASGRSLVLSDAGKIMLKESEASVAAPAPAPAVRLLSIGNKLFSLAPAAPAAPRDNTRDTTRDNTRDDVKAAPAPRAEAAGARGALKARPAVKIIMNKANFSKLLAQNQRAVPIQFPLRTVNANSGVGGEAAGGSAGAAGSVEAGGAAGADDEAARLRRELAAARATIAALSAQLQRRSGD